MASRKLSLAAIRRVLSALPGLEAGMSYRMPAWRWRKKLLVRVHQDDISIVLWIGSETRDHLLQADPKTFFVTDHYRGTPAVQARRDSLTASDLGKLARRAIENASLRS